MNPLVRTARITGLLYLGLAITGGLGFLLMRARLFVGRRPRRDAGQPGRARVARPRRRRPRAAHRRDPGARRRVVLPAVPHRRRRWPPAASPPSASSTRSRSWSARRCWRTAVDIALDPIGDAAADRPDCSTWSAATCGAWARCSSACGSSRWAGACSARGWMPRALGWILVGGGIGYVLSAFVGYLAPGAPALADALTDPATVGEFWMIGYLLVRGVRRAAA